MSINANTLQLDSLTTNSLTMPTGAVNNYVLTSDALGVATWKDATATLSLTGDANGLLNNNIVSKASGNFNVTGMQTNQKNQWFNNQVQSKLIALYDSGTATNQTQHNFYGFGMAGVTLRYQVDTTSADHVFYAGTSTTTSNELFRIKGTGAIIAGGNIQGGTLTSTGLLTAGSITTSGTLASGVHTISGVSQQIKVQPSVLNAESSIVFHTTTNGSGGSQWTLGQGSYTVGSGNFGIGVGTAGQCLKILNTGAISTPYNFTGGTINSTGLLTAGSITTSGTVGTGAITCTSINNSGTYQQSSITILTTLGPTDNLKIGRFVGNGTSTGVENVFAGAWIANSLTSGYENNAYGAYSLSDITSGNMNVSVGAQSGSLLTTGSSNVFLGAFSHTSLGSVNNSMALGANSIVSADNTIVLGDPNVTSLIPMSNGLCNLGSSTVPFGAITSSGLLTCTGINNNGSYKQLDPLGAWGPILTCQPASLHNTLVGFYAGNAITTGGGNCFMGQDCGQNNTTGSNNSLVGTFCGFINATGSSNTAMGSFALAGLSNGDDNVSIGYNTMNGVTSASGNVAVGSKAMQSASGSFNTAIGFQVLKSSSGTINTGVGSGALLFCTTGSYNTALGANALQTLTTNSNNTAVGVVIKF